MIQSLLKLLDTFEEFFESVIFRLSPVLGGRSEVLSTSVMELAQYIKLEERKEEAERLDMFMLYLHANPMVDPKERKKYLKTISPTQRAEQLNMETDLTQLEQLKMLQEHRANHVNKGG